MEANYLDSVPEALGDLSGLEALALTKNLITRINNYAFKANPRLITIGLSTNDIEVIEDDAFIGLGKLRVLNLYENRLKYLPKSISHLTSLVELHLNKNELTHLPNNSFHGMQKLRVVNLDQNLIISIGHHAFTNLPHLTQLLLSSVTELTVFPDFSGTNNIKKIVLDRAKIKSIPPNLCSIFPHLLFFNVQSNKIGTIPDVRGCKYLHNLNLANNELTSLEGEQFRNSDSLLDLSLEGNYIHSIPQQAFIGLTKLKYLSLANNRISEIHEEAFVPLANLKRLNLGNNNIYRLPTKGLLNLQSIHVFGNKELREFPPKEEFPQVQTFVLAYAYHCCDYINSGPELEEYDMIREQFQWMGDVKKQHQPVLDSMSRAWENHSKFWLDEYDNTNLSYDLSSDYENYDYNFLEDTADHANTWQYIRKGPVSCKPKPGPFMPCDDLFGWWILRCGVWVVFMLALLGNFVVLFVSVSSKSKMDVPRFLICHLAFADFCMGIYLAFLAIEDAATLGQFKKFAISWQLSHRCIIAGVFGIFSSEFSVFTLTVITVERFYVITNAMHRNKRLSLKSAIAIMLCGGAMCFTLAMLPLFGISDYRKFAVCMPFEIGDPISKAYVCLIMIVNGISFFIILSCYIIMYVKIRGTQTWNSNDTRVAKKMFVLVFTDFVCWSPIAVLSLTAAFGKNLIPLEHAKFLTIFVLPLNSCANPFLYAFFTKQFKNDCVLLCRRLEDSSIARHFSQASQRHGSVSLKCHPRRPSALRSLMGDSKYHNSHNSSDSNSYGLVNNYNSRSSNSCEVYRPRERCARCDAGCEDILLSKQQQADAQIVLHQEFSSLTASDTKDNTTETEIERRHIRNMTNLQDETTDDEQNDLDDSDQVRTRLLDQCDDHNEVVWVRQPWLENDIFVDSLPRVECAVVSITKKCIHCVGNTSTSFKDNTFAVENENSFQNEKPYFSEEVKENTKFDSSNATVVFSKDIRNHKGWRKNLHCCLANCSPNESKFRSCDKINKIKKNQTARSSQQAVQYVMYMPHKELEALKNKSNAYLSKKLNSPKVQNQSCQSKLGSISETHNTEENIPTNHKSQNETENKTYVCEEKENEIITSQIKDNEKPESISSGNNLNTQSDCKGDIQVDSSTTCKENKKKQAKTSSMAHKHCSTALAKELLKKLSSVDKSFHLKYFQQSIERNKTQEKSFMCKSNSLMELTQLQSFEPSCLKRGSLTQTDNYQGLSRGELSDSILCKPQETYQDEDIAHSNDMMSYPVFTSLEKYLRDEAQDDDDSNLVGRDKCWNVLRNSASDRKQADNAEIGGLLELSNQTRDSSLSRNSADKESGFHSQ